MLIWGDGKTVRNRRIGQLAVRDALAWVEYSNGNYPNLDALNLVGRGTVQFNRAGCRIDNTADGAIHVAPTVNLAFDNRHIDHGQGNWIGGGGCASYARGSGSYRILGAHLGDRPYWHSGWRCCRSL